MESNSEMNAATGTPEPATMSFGARLVGVYLEPGKTFHDINRRSTWLGIFILLAIATMAMQFAILSRIPREVRLEKSIEASPIKIPEEQLEKIRNAPPSPLEKAGLVISIPGILIVYLIIAAIFLLAFMITGVSLNFKKVLSITFWGLAPPAIILILLAIIIMYAKDPVTLELNPTDNLITSLGFLADKTQPALHSLLKSIDIFSIWTIALLSFGFEAVSGGALTKKKAAVVTIILWLIWVLGKMGFTALFGKIVLS
jgi:hypothetical protein